jgi:anthranilate/para-aminobenzoate synthase component I
MTFVALETCLVPDAVALAAQVWQRPGAVVLWSADGSGPSYVACEPDRTATGLDPDPCLTFDPEAGNWGDVPRWVGVLPYEAERERMERPDWCEPDLRPPALVAECRWWRYPAVAVIGRRVTIVGDDWAAVRRLKSLLESRVSIDLSFSISLRPGLDSESAHRRRIEAALGAIGQGEIYEINLARRFELDLRGSALGCLVGLSRWAPAPFAAGLRLPGPGEGRPLEVVSTSPELFLDLSPSGRVVTLPIKGTRPRGSDAASDRALLAELAADPKEHAELAMVVDIERNDLGRVARIGSIVTEPPHLIPHRSVFHRQAQVSAWLCPGVNRAELLASLLPSGSITGAPKVRAMELVRAWELHRRGLYTGAFGFVTRAGGMRLAMAIRTLCARGGRAEYFVGGGIVADSQPDREVEETRWKAAQLLKAARAGR